MEESTRLPMLSQRFVLFGGGVLDVVVISCGGDIVVVSTSSSSGWLGASLSDVIDFVLLIRKEAERADAESKAPDIAKGRGKCNIGSLVVTLANELPSERLL